MIGLRNFMDFVSSEYLNKDSFRYTYLAFLKMKAFLIGKQGRQMIRFGLEDVDLDSYKNRFTYIFRKYGIFRRI